MEVEEVENVEEVEEVENEKEIDEAENVEEIDEVENVEVEFADDVAKVDEVYLGSGNILDPAPPTPTSRFEVINIDDENASEHFYSPHKIPNNLWSVFERNRGVEETVPTLTPESETELSTEEIVASGLDVAGVMTYDVSEAEPTLDGELVEIDDLPKPSEHESEVLVIERVSETEENQNESGRKDPKSFEFNLPGVQSVDQEGVKVHSFGAEQIIPLR